MMLKASLLAAALMQATAEPAPNPVAAPAREIAPGVHLLPGDFYEGRGPDGNTIILEARDGLVVVDTGRHVWHSDGILEFARARGAPVVAIVNTHWHVDHSGGNLRVKTAFPEAPLYASSAAHRALDAGLLTSGITATQARLASGELNEQQAAEARAGLARMEALRPDVAVDASQSVAWGGTPFDVRLAQNAATDGDVWIYDAAHRIAIVGDLVTLPEPFFDTGCPQGWAAALDSIWASPFETLIPGHGEPMSRAQFGIYRAAFADFIACAAADTQAEECGAEWARAVDPIQPSDFFRAEAAESATAYIGYLRENGGRSPYCLTG